MPRALHRYTFDVTADEATFNNQQTSKKYLDFSDFLYGQIYVAIGDNPNSVTTLTFYSIAADGFTATPMFKADGSTAVTATIPGTAHAAGASVPLPAECQGCNRIAIKSTDTVTISITCKR